MSEEPQSDQTGGTSPSSTAYADGNSNPASSASSPSVSEPDVDFNMDTVDEYAQSFPAFRSGDVVQGVVVHIDRDGVLVDVGAKSEGIIPPGELSRENLLDPEKALSVGDKIAVYIMQLENQDGNIVLSKKRADFEKAWERVQESKVSGETIVAMVTDRVKGGLVVDLGIRGFVPASHVGSGSLKTNLEKYLGQSIPLKVIEVDKERKKVVLSNKLAMEEERQSKRDQTITDLAVGQTRRGTVRRLTNYGAFVDLGGIDGLLHISEMSWTRVNHPSEVLKEGQELDVYILKMDIDGGRVSLGLRQILTDPWTSIESHLQVGTLIYGTVTRIVPFGVFVQVDGGIEGIIPNSELAARKGGKSGTPAQGADVEVKIIDLRPDERKLILSMKQAFQEEEERQERAVVQEFEASPEREEPRFTIGDHIRAKESTDEDEVDAEEA